MAVDVKEALTRKLGPLPAWGWGVALGGGILAFRFIRGGIGGGSGEQAAASGAPTFVNPAPTELGEQQSGFLSALSGQLDALPDQVAVAVAGALSDTIIPPPQTGPTSASAPPATSPAATAPPKLVASPTPAPSASAPLSIWATLRASLPTAYQSFTSLDDAKAYAGRVIRNYSPGGAFYGKGAVGDRYAIPTIPTSVLSAAEQKTLATQYGGTIR
jgi:hypothetical protein